MAYSNWGAFVFRNRERTKTHEDAIPYKEQEGSSGFPLVLLEREGTLGAHHAVLGAGRVRLCVYKTTPHLFLDGRDVTVEVNARLVGSRERDYQIKRGDKIVGWREGKCQLLPAPRDFAEEYYQLAEKGLTEGVWGIPQPGEKGLRWRYIPEHKVIVTLHEDEDNETPKFGEDDEGVWEGELDGYKFRVNRKNNETTLELREPDGTLWTAIAGYEYGAGFMGDHEASPLVASV